MKKNILIAGILAANMFALAQEKKVVDDFSQLSVKDAAGVHLQKSDSSYVIADFSAVSISSENNTLTVKLLKNNKDHSGKVIVGYKQLNNIEIDRAASVKSTDTLRGDKLKITASSAASCKLPLICNDLQLVLSDAAIASLSGKATKLNATISRASGLKAENLQTDEATVTVSGASSAKVFAAKKLVGNASGASTLKFKGNPAIKQLNQTGASSIKNYDETSTSITIVTDEDPVITKGSAPGDTAKHYKFSGGRIEVIFHDKDSTKKKVWQYTHNWSGVELFENGYLTSSGSTTLPSSYNYMSLKYGLRNLGWNLNLFEKDFRFANNHMQVVTGLGLSFVGYAFDNKIKLNADSSYTSAIYNPNETASFVKNKLKESFITVPLLLELNTSKKMSKNFHIAVGVIGGVRIDSRTRQVYTQDNHTYRDIRKDDYNLAPFKLDATARVGLGKFTMFATYSLTPLFQANKGPQLYPFTVGVRFIPW